MSTFLERVYAAYGIEEDVKEAVVFGSGLINNTWKVRWGGQHYILQRINDQVFRDPHAIACNIQIVAEYLRERHPDYLFVTPVKTADGNDMYVDKEAGYFRLMPFIEGSHTIDVVEETGQAFEAARQFGRFTKLLSGFNETKLAITLPDFHNLSLRYKQFQQSLVSGNPGRIRQAAGEIQKVQDLRFLVTTFEEICNDPGFRTRATHHDTKISNVLFDASNRGICVIDLDTMMPGYFISDLGDMLRTYLSPVGEEERDFSKIAIREEYFEAIMEGYLGQLGNELTIAEKTQVVYAGKFMIYMQALRFLTDYLNDDVYYGARYETHNFMRAGNQLALLSKLMQVEDRLQKIVSRLLLQHA